MNIWTYWEGPVPKFIHPCLRSMRKAFREDDFHVVTPANLRDYISPNALHPNFSKLLDVIGEGNRHMLSGIRAGCLRAALLATHGGWWFDADTIGLRSPRPLVEAHENAEAIYTVWADPNKPTRILNGYIYMVRDLASEWLQQINRKLKQLEKIRWCALGEGILTPLLTGHDAAVKIRRELVLPLDVDSDAEAFFRPGDPNDYITPDTVCFGLNCSYMLYWHRRDMAPPWDRDIMIHRLLRQTQEGLA